MDDPIRTRRDVAIRIVLSENEWDAVLKIVMAVSFAAAFAPVASKHDLPCASRYQKMMDDLSALSALAGEAPSENPPIVDIRNLMFTLLEQITPVVWDAARNESSTPPDEKSGLITGSMYPTPAGQGTTTPPPSPLSMDLEALAVDLGCFRPPLNCPAYQCCLTRNKRWNHQRLWLFLMMTRVSPRVNCSWG